MRIWKEMDSQDEGVMDGEFDFDLKVCRWRKRLPIVHGLESCQ